MSQDLIWRNQGPWLSTNQGGPEGGGGGTPADSGAVRGHDRLDDIRMNPNKGLDQPYPDGYLGTVENRNKDKLAQGVSGRLTDRHYQRGVHKGTKMDPGQYYWPADAQFDRGMTRPARVDPETFLLVQPRQG